MSTMLTKGFEVEMYTGRPDGTVEGCSRDALRALPDLAMAIEPDRRNLEYLTPPDADYGRQLHHLLLPRRRLRSWLAGRGLTLLPGSTLSLGTATALSGRILTTIITPTSPPPTAPAS